jgi:hypothetical protein
MLAPGTALHMVIAAEESLLRLLAERDRLGTPPPRSLAGCVAALAAGERRRRDALTHAARAEAAVTAHDAWASRHPDETPPAHVLNPGDAWVARLAHGLELWQAGVAGTHTAPTDYAAHGGAAAMRAVRGLVALRRFEPARDILLALGQMVRDGLVPSDFDANGWPRYEAPEASLWFVLAAELFARRTGEHEFVRRSLLASLEQVIERFRAGTKLGVGLRDDGLLGAGDDGAARADLNALWYAAQAAMGQLAKALKQKQSGAFYLAAAREQHVRFNEALWDEPLGAPYVALGPAGPVRGLEPSSLLAASLSPPLLAPERARSLLAAIERELLTPAGLRVAPGESRIQPEWLAHYLTALVRAHGRGAAAQERARAALSRLEAVIDRCGAGQLPEAFESDDAGVFDTAPLQVAGEPVSLAATTELLRFWIEELDHAEDAVPADV